MVAPKSPRALAGRLRRAQTPLRALGIEISFGREGRAGTRIIRLRASRTKPTRTTVSTVSTVGKDIDRGLTSPEGAGPRQVPGVFSSAAAVLTVLTVLIPQSCSI